MYNVEFDGSKSNMMKMREIFCILLLGVIIFALGVTGGIFIGIYAYHGGPDNNQPNINVECITKRDNGTSTNNPNNGAATFPFTKEPSKCEVNACPKRKAQFVSVQPEIFAPLTNEEMKDIREFMVAEGLVTNKIGSEINLQSNYITGMDPFVPKKADVVKYLDRNGQFPGRYARITVNRGARSKPDCMIYLVGVLGSSKMTAKKMYSDGEIAFEARPIDALDLAKYNELLEPLGKVVEPITKESFDGAYLNGGGLYWWPYEGPPGNSEKQRETRLSAYFSPLDSYADLHLLDMLPLSVAIHCNGNDPSHWYIKSIYYINQGPFSSPQELLQAYNNHTIRKVKYPAGYAETVRRRFYVGRDDSKPLRANANMPPPRTYEPEGPRYTINGHHVRWMGWSFDVTSRMMRGGAVYDVRYKNNRIAYEIALNEISLVYASDSFERSILVYSDSTYGIGFHNGSIRDVDCPSHASMLESSYYDAFSGKGVRTKAICVFERDGEGAAWRHRYNSYQAGLRQSYLVVRLSVNVINYDYILDYEFHLDGKVYIKVKATGFIQTAFWDPNNPNRDSTKDSGQTRDSFGYKVTDYGHGLIHDHMFGFKIDLDIVDTVNSFEVIHFKSGDVVDAFKAQNPSITTKPHYLTNNVTRYLQYETIQRNKDTN